MFDFLPKNKPVKDNKMKTRMIFYTFLTFLLVSSCMENQPNFIVNGFVQELIISGEIDKIEEYLNLGEEVKSKTDYLAFFKESFQSIRNELADGCNLNYELLTFNQARNSDLSTFEQYEKKYSKFEKVYFIVCGEKIILPIIQKNNKIISFQSSILKKDGGNYSPFLLNE